MQQHLWPRKQENQNGREQRGLKNIQWNYCENNKETGQNVTGEIGFEPLVCVGLHGGVIH